MQTQNADCSWLSEVHAIALLCNAPLTYPLRFLISMIQS